MMIEVVTMNRLHATFVLACILTDPPAFAADSAVEPQKQGDIAFVSGGVGADENQALDSVQSEYNLHMLFAVKGTGEYASDIKVKILDANGKTVLDTVSSGPRLFVKVPTGRYKIVADKDGHSIEETVSAPAKHWKLASFYWPMEK
jgi:hypothetical protein